MTWRSALRLVGATARAVPQRVGALTVALFATAGVGAVFLAEGALRAGLRTAFLGASDPHVVMVLRRGATSELVSALGGEDLAFLRDAPEARRVSPELVLVVSMARVRTGRPGSVTLRGVEAEAFALRPSLRVVEGRAPRAGRRELIAGAGAARRFAGLGIGARIELAGRPWTVVGRFHEPGRANTEVWGDLQALQSAYRRHHFFQTARVWLRDPGLAAALARRADADPRRNLRVTRHRDYYARQFGALERVIEGLGSLLGVLVTLGAVLATLDAAAAASGARARELALLRALGFTRWTLACALTLEHCVLFAAAGGVGVAVATLGLHEMEAATLDFSGFTTVGFRLEVAPGGAARAMAIAVLAGLVGSAIPVHHVLRAPIAPSLR